MNSDDSQNPWVIGSHLTWEGCCTAPETEHLPTANNISSGGSRARGGDSLSLRDISTRDNSPESSQDPESRSYRFEPPQPSSQSFQGSSSNELLQPSRKKRRRGQRERQRNQTEPPQFSSAVAMPETGQQAPHPMSMPRTVDNLLNPSSIRGLFPHLAKNLSDAEMEEKLRLGEKYRDDSYMRDEVNRRSKEQDAHRAEHRQI